MMFIIGLFVGSTLGVLTMGALIAMVRGYKEHRR